MVNPQKIVLKNWRGCRRCGLHKYRHNIVIGETHKPPVAIMFVGEGPGRSEDLIGRPFIGPSGKLLRKAIETVEDMLLKDVALKLCFTNVVACRPCDSVQAPNRPPTEEEAWACMPRFMEVLELVNPLTVVFLGLVPERFLRHLRPEAAKLIHPAAVLRSGGTDSSSYLPFLRGIEEVIKHTLGVDHG